MVLDGVGFAFEDEVVLTALDLRLAPGEVVALVGSTGSGKTTFWQPQSPTSSTRGGQGPHRRGPPDRVDPGVLARRASALVFQETFLFADTVRENLAMGDDIDDDAILAASWRSPRRGASSSACPHGLDEVIGERGVTLSGGQRQRPWLNGPSCAARASSCSTTPPPRSTRRWSGPSSTGCAARSATTLVVAHRVSTIALADRVLLLDDGRITAMGTHRELLSVPAYAALVRAYEHDDAA